MKKNTVFYHLNRRPSLTAVLPTKFDSFGKLPEPVVFLTSKEHIKRWAAYIRDNQPNQPIYVYQIELPAKARIEVGPDGEENGDFRLISNQPVKCKFFYQL